MTQTLPARQRDETDDFEMLICDLPTLCSIDAMKCLRLLVALSLLPLALSAADRPLKIDKARSYIDVDVKTTINFTGRLENYDTTFSVDSSGKIKTAVLYFKFADLKTGKTDRDAKMIEWLGGGAPEGKFVVGILALAPDGQGQVTGKLTFHGQSQVVRGCHQGSMRHAQAARLDAPLVAPQCCVPSA